MRPDIRDAVHVLNAGGMVIYPTETVYGIGVDAYSKKAIEKLFEIKGRNSVKPVSVAVSSIEMAKEIAHIDEFSEKFIRLFLPGPITIILPAKEVLPESLTAKDGTIGIRMPDHQVAQLLISRFGRPVTSTSANKSGEPAPIRPEDIMIEYDLLLDGGVLPGVPSTVVDMKNRIILRDGKMSGEVNDYIRSK